VVIGLRDAFTRMIRMALKVKITQRRPADLTNEALSIRFAGDAESYAMAAMTLTDFKFYSVRYHLFCQAFELILKSFILSAGADQRTTFKIGHNLKKALSTAVSLGYRPSHPDLDMLVDWLHPFHEGNDFRYARGGYQLLPTAEDLFAAFKVTHAEISPLARAFHLSKHPPDA
jgi:hypothetical protein